MITVAYVPHSPDFSAPGDRRRLCAYARHRGIELVVADPARTYDVVVVSASADIATWSRRRRSGEQIVYDIVDSYLAGRTGPKELLRGTAKYVLGDLGRPVLSYRRAIGRMCARADAVVCSTVEQRRAIERFCPNVHVILDVVDDVAHEVKRDYRSAEPLNIFWEGQPYTLHHFATLRDVIAQLNRERPVALHLMTLLNFGRWSGRIGNVETRKLIAAWFDRAYLYQWNAQLLSRVATGCDLAVIPLDLRDAFARGKPENKLLSMWRMGLPTLVSATPAYGRAMAQAGLEMTCASDGEWLSRLRRYGDDEPARRAAGTLGREYAVSEHGTERILERWDSVFASVGVTVAPVSSPLR